MVLGGKIKNKNKKKEKKKENSKFKWEFISMASLSNQFTEMGNLNNLLSFSPFIITFRYIYIIATLFDC